ncbi:Set1 complex component ash2 [Fulvia fulva]|uniref:Set1 complex component ash2 n=1 Tax=Passalora fulva TaxID=5499 RepID=A0A9Q8P511_PASFU|nr:Set1 complex component ash2 [Fulvia fulva]KAK4632327.1 Set1 complex component ash2 [Fulvia fulva]KAK4633712.1 Set1 complex component ash2 [Fulvia fulva]UJO13411.1 Set1 complex component ash2 [Fulvia fulva]WPV11112.1 Set1 complex component ash2 [Fulvia fulva]WPV26257.1 Set1 complex component ash2 [Fulvia fulva]
MADISNAQTPLHSTLEQEHAPNVPSPLNPSTSRAASRTPAPPIERERREKKESLKKRESNAHNETKDTKATSSSLGKRKASVVHTYPSPQRFNVPPPRAVDFEEPKEDVMVGHEPFPLTMPQSERQLYKPIDLAENKRGYRYSRAIADPLFPHKQFYRSTSPPPHYARLSFEDADKWMHFTTNALITTNEKGWRMVRSNVCAREGTLYYEIRIHKGVPREGPDTTASGPEPHVRFGFARREAPLDAPVGFDGYSYGITDIRFETMHRSRPGKFFHSKKTKAKGAKAAAGAAPTPVTLAPEDQHVKEGDVIGVELQLPSLPLHHKIATGEYNPAADQGDGFDQGADKLDEPMDVIRDRIPVPYKGNSYFEVLDHVPSKAMEMYADRTMNLASAASLQGTSAKEGIKQPPNPNHEQPSLRTLPSSAIRVYKNGKLIGTAFENLLAFLPPASAPSKTMGAREGFDDGLVGYFPAVSCFFGGIAEVNFGDGNHGFWAPPAHLKNTKAGKSSKRGPDVDMPDAGLDASKQKAGWNPGRTLRGIGERYKEQVAEDIVWDLVDEVDFFVQDGGYEGTVGSGAVGADISKKSSRLKEED